MKEQPKGGGATIHMYVEPDGACAGLAIGTTPVAVIDSLIALDSRVEWSAPDTIT